MSEDSEALLLVLRTEQMGVERVDPLDEEDFIVGERDRCASTGDALSRMKTIAGRHDALAA